MLVIFSWTFVLLSKFHWLQEVANAPNPFNFNKIIKFAPITILIIFLRLARREIPSGLFLCRLTCRIDDSVPAKEHWDSQFLNQANSWKLDNIYHIILTNPMQLLEIIKLWSQLHTMRMRFALLPYWTRVWQFCSFGKTFVDATKLDGFTII